MPMLGMWPVLHSSQESTLSQVAAQTPSWPLMVTDSCWCKAKDPSFSTDQDPTIVPGDITCYSYKAVPHYPDFLFLPLFIVPISFLFLHHLLAHVSGALCLFVSGVILGIVSGVLFPALGLWHQAGVISGMVLPAQCWIGAHLRLLFCPGPLVLV